MGGRGFHWQKNTGCQMVNVEAGLELENQHFVTFIVKTGSGNNHQWMLNLGDMFDEEWDIYMVTKHFPPDCFLAARSQIVTTQCRHRPTPWLGEWITINTNTERLMDICGSRRKALRRTQHHLRNILTGIHTLNLIMKKHQTNPKWGMFY